MRSHRLPVDDVSRDTLLIRAHSGNDTEGSRVDLLATITNDADNDFLPTISTPGLAAITLAQIGDILHDAVHRPRKKGVILVIHSHDNE
jgi:hypothetical protein